MYYKPHTQFVVAHLKVNGNVVGQMSCTKKKREEVIVSISAKQKKSTGKWCRREKRQKENITRSEKRIKTKK